MQGYEERSRKFYDAHAGRQTQVGINDRHLAIRSWWRRERLRPDARVLEIGCGVGTQTELLALDVRDGKVTALDLSERSIEVARKRLKAFPNVELVCANAVTHELSGQYDLILLPDVLEHIPSEHHGVLLEKLAAHLSPHGFVLIHIPDPEFILWSEKAIPETLQEIDQALHTDELAAHARKAGLRITYLETYSIWRRDDYQVVVLRKQLRHAAHDRVPRSLAKRLKTAARRLRRLANGRAS